MSGDSDIDAIRPGGEESSPSTDPGTEPDIGPSAPYRRQVVRNTVATGVANGWVIALMVVALPLMLHGLGAEAFGTWVLLQSFSAVTGWLSLADLGTALATTRLVADRSAVDDTAGARRAAVTGLCVAGAIGSACAVVLTVGGLIWFPALFSTPDDLVDDLRVATVALAIQVAFEMVEVLTGASLDGLQRIDLSRTMATIRRTAVVVVAVVVALAGGGLSGVSVAVAAATIVGVAIGVVVLFRQLDGHGFRPDRSDARGLLRHGIPIWVLNGTGDLHRTMDRLIVGAVLGPGSVALVEIATQIQNGVSAVLSSVSYTVTSSAAWVRSRGDTHRLAELFLRGTKFACLATLPLCGLLAVLASPLVTVWVGVAYVAAAGLVVLGLVYLAIQTPVATGSNLLVGIGRTRDVTAPALLAVGVNLVLSLVLVHTNGIAGVFVATIISGLVLAPLLLRAVIRATETTLSTFFRQAVAPAIIPLAGTLLATGAVRALGLSPWPTVIIGGVVGVAAWGALTFGLALDVDDRRDLVRALPGR